MPLNIHYKIESVLSTITPITQSASYFYGYIIEKKKEEIVSLPMYAFGRPLINI